MIHAENLPDDSDVIAWVQSHPDVKPNSMQRGMDRIGLFTLAYLGLLILLAWAGLI